MQARRSRRTRKEPPEIVPPKSDDEEEDDDEGNDDDSRDKDDASASTKNSKKSDSKTSQRRSKRARKPTAKSAKALVTNRRRRRNSNSSGEGLSKGDAASSDSSEGDEDEPSSRPTRTSKRKATRSSKDGSEISTDEDDESNQDSSSDNKASDNPSDKEEGNADEDEDSSDNEPLSAKIKRKRITSKAAKARAALKADDASGQEDGDHSEENSSKKPLAEATAKKDAEAPGDKLPQKRGGRGPRRRTRQDKAPTLSSDDEGTADDEEPSRKRKRGRPRRTQAKDKAGTVSEDGTSAESEDDIPKKKPSRSTRAKRKQGDEDSDAGDNKEPDKKGKAAEGEDSDVENDKESDSASKAKEASTNEKSKKPAGETKTDAATTDDVATESESSRGSRRSRRKRKKPNKLAGEGTSEEDASEPADSSGEEDLVNKERPEQKRKLSVIESEGEEEANDGKTNGNSKTETDAMDEEKSKEDETPKEKPDEDDEGDAMETDSLPDKAKDDQVTGNEGEAQKDSSEEPEAKEPESDAIGDDKTASKETNDQTPQSPAKNEDDDSKAEPPKEMETEKVEDTVTVDDNLQAEDETATKKAEPETNADVKEKETAPSEEKKEAGDLNVGNNSGPIPEGSSDTIEKPAADEKSTTAEGGEEKTASTDEKKSEPMGTPAEETKPDTAQPENQRESAEQTEHVSAEKEGGDSGKILSEAISVEPANDGAAEEETKVADNALKPDSKEPGSDRAEESKDLNTKDGSETTKAGNVTDSPEPEASTEPINAEATSAPERPKTAEPNKQTAEAVVSDTNQDEKVLDAKAKDDKESEETEIATQVASIDKPAERMNGTETTPKEPPSKSMEDPVTQEAAQEDAMDVDESPETDARGKEQESKEPQSTPNDVEERGQVVVSDSVEPSKGAPSRSNDPVVASNPETSIDKFQEAKAKGEESDDDIELFHDAHMELPTEAGSQEKKPVAAESKANEETVKESKRDQGEATSSAREEAMDIDDKVADADKDTAKGQEGISADRSQKNSPEVTKSTDAEVTSVPTTPLERTTTRSREQVPKNNTDTTSEVDAPVPLTRKSMSRRRDSTPKLLPEDFEQHYTLTFGPSFDTKNEADERTAPRVDKVDKLDRIKVLLYAAGGKVHRGRGFERIFSGYWDAMSLRLSDRLSSHTSKQCDKAIMTFLKTRQLRKLHNRLVLSILRQASRRQLDLERVASHIPTSWKSRVTKGRKEIEPSPTSMDPVDTAPITAKSSKELHTFYQESWERPVMKQAAEANQTRRQKVLVASKHETSSSKIPGVLAVEPLVRRIVGQNDMQVSDTAVWLIVVALKEHTKNVLKSTMSRKEALGRGELEPPIISFPKVLATQSKSTSKKDATAEPSGEKPTTDDRNKLSTQISALDLYYGLSSLPIGNVGSMGGSVSRTAVERCLYSSYDNFPMQPMRDFDEVHDYLTERIFSEARTRKLTPKPREDEKTSTSNSVKINDQSFAVPPPAPAPPRKTEVTVPPPSVVQKVPAPTAEPTPPAPAAEAPASGTPVGEESANAGIRGMGRGAKNLAALIRRSTPAASTAETGQSDSGTATASGSTDEKTTDEKKELNADATDKPADGADSKSESGADGQKQGKGFGRKNLSALKARASTDDEPKSDEKTPNES